MKNGTLSRILNHVQNIVLYAVFALYLVFMAKLLVVSRISIEGLPGSFGAIERSVNLIPFASIIEYIRGETATIARFAFSNVIGNIIAFVPLGAYLPLLRRDKRIGINLLLVFLVSLIIEIGQGIFGIGAADVDDIILNCIGGLIGILGFRLLQLILRKDNYVRTTIAVLSLIGAPVLVYYTFVIRLRL